MQNGAEEVGFVDLLTGRQNHFHLVMAAQGAGMVEVYSTQLLHTRDIIIELGEEKNNMITVVDNCTIITIILVSENEIRGCSSTRAYLLQSARTNMLSIFFPHLYLWLSNWRVVYSGLS